MNNLKIGARLGIGFAVVLMLTVFMTGIGIWRLQAINEAVRDEKSQVQALDRTQPGLLQHCTRLVSKA